MIVLDASALVDMILDRPGADWLVERVTEDSICAPSHQPSEALSAFARMERAGLLTAGACRGAAAEAVSLPEELVAPSRKHVLRALALAAEIRVVDGLYVALAEERDCPLLTTDRRLAGAVTTCEVVAPG